MVCRLTEGQCHLLPPYTHFMYLFPTTSALWLWIWWGATLLVIWATDRTSVVTSSLSALCRGPSAYLFGKQLVSVWTRDGHSSSVAVLKSSKCHTDSRSCSSQASTEETMKQTQAHGLVHTIGQPAEFKAAVKGAYVGFTHKNSKYDHTVSRDHSWWVLSSSKNNLLKITMISEGLCFFQVVSDAT